MTMAPWVK